MTQDINLQEASNFRVIFDKIPNTELFAQGISLPTITSNEAIRQTPFLNYKVPGDKIVFLPFTIDFLVDENFASYLDIYNWILGLGFPDSHEQHRLLKAEGLTSDVTVTVLKNSKMKHFEIKFKDVFPIDLQGFDFSAALDGSTILTSAATFQLSSFEFNFNV